MAGSRKSPSTDPVVEAVAACLRRHLGSGESIAVALSGGIDSVVLLHVLRGFRWPLVAIHVDHGLSPNSGSWSEFCRKLCAGWGIPLEVRRVMVQRGSSDGLEAAARRARHAELSASSADWIGLAHHRGDRAETMLFNLLRGAGVRGAGAMPERSGRMLRPLLSVGRGEILEYAQAQRITWVEDESNADIRHSRNFLRHRIIPELRQRFPAVESRLAAAAGRMAEAADLLDDLARLDLGGHFPAFPIPVSLLAALPEARARNVLRYLLACHGIGIPSEERMIEGLRQFLAAGPDRHPSLVLGPVRLSRRKGMVSIETPGP